MTCTCEPGTDVLKAHFTNRTAKVWSVNRRYLVTPETEHAPPETVVGICTIDSFGFRGQISGECDECWNTNLAAIRANARELD